MNRRGPTYTLLHLLLITLTTTVIGQNKYAGEFLELGVGARAAALGGAQTADVGDVTSGYYNPAGLLRLNVGEVAYNHAKLFIDDINYDYAAMAIPWGTSKSLGLSVIRLGVDNILHTEAYDPSSGEVVNESQFDPSIHRTRIIDRFSHASYAVLLSFAKIASPVLDFGANIKLIYRTDQYNSAYGIGFDAGIQYLYNENLKFGAILRDVTTTVMVWNTGKREQIVPSLRLGSAYTFHLGEHNQVTPMVDLTNYFDGRSIDGVNIGSWNTQLIGGIEYRYRNLIHFRSGYNDVKAWSFGTGFSHGPFSFDYAYVLDRDNALLGDIHRINIKFEIRSGRFARPANSAHNSRPF